MSFRRTWASFIVLIVAGLPCAEAQQAVSSIEQARLTQELPSSSNTKVTADGMVMADDNATSDDGFGEVLILESQPRTRMFAVTGDASVFYTNNAALTRHDTIDDTFFAANAAISWRFLNSHLNAQLAAHSSIFRYDSTPSLDFASLGGGAGLFWNPEHFAGVGLFANYDFIELIDRHSREILRDHAFTIGAQKGFPLGRRHALVSGVTLTAGVSEPESAQRDQAALFLGYRFQVTRSLGVELLYRFAGYYYTETGRIDRNQILSANAHYRLWEWADIKAFFSLVDNRSDDSAFNYDAVTTGGGLSAAIEF